LPGIMRPSWPDAPANRFSVVAGQLTARRFSG
jgi:hypothetical protein